MMASSPRANLMLPNLVSRPSVSRMKVELDKKSLFALASDTRVEILKSLQPMRRTVSQLAESLNIDKAAVHRPLKKMEDGGLVVRFEDHGFVYYGLSWKARDLMSPGENTRIIIMFSSAWIMIGIVALIVASLAITAAGPTGIPTDRSTNETGYRQMDKYWYEIDQQSLLPVGLACVAFGTVGAFVMMYSFRQVRRPKQGSPREAENISAPRPDPED